MKRIFILIFCLLAIGCTSDNQNLSDLIQGEWISTDDSSSKIVFEGDVKKDIYDEELISSAPFVVESFVNEIYLIVSGDDEDFKYSISELTEDSLSLRYVRK